MRFGLTFVSPWSLEQSICVSGSARKGITKRWVALSNSVLASMS